MERPVLSVILCTYNPNRAVLDEAIASIARQQDAPAFEFILVDNNSSPALDAARLAPLPAAARPRLVIEPRQGLSFARSRGIAEAGAGLLCFIDDDNVLDPGYLASAARIGAEHPELGAFAGRAIGRFGRAPSWLHRRHIARYAVRDHGPEPIHGSGARWGPWEPIGAGLVVRSDIAGHFRAMVEASEDAAGLGRTGRSLASGEDSLISRIADRLGYEVGYRPELSLEHIIAPGRLSLRYLLGLVEAQARSQVVLDRICARSAPPPPPRWRQPDLLARRFVSRIRTPGLDEAITHIWWDRGVWDQQRRPVSDAETTMADYLAGLRPDAPRRG